MIGWALQIECRIIRSTLARQAPNRLSQNGSRDLPSNIMPSQETGDFRKSWKPPYQPLAGVIYNGDGC